MEYTKRQMLEALKQQLILERSSYLSHWRDLGEFFSPRRPRWTSSDVNRGDRRNHKIIDSSPAMAVRTLRAGMMSGITSPARPWFRLTTPDPDMAEFGKVKAWLHDVNQILSTSFLRSNYYKVKPIVYGDIGVFGTAAYSIEEDIENVFNCQSFPIGSYCLAHDARGKLNTFYREFRMTVRQLVEKFGEQDPRTGKPRWDLFSKRVKEAWDKGNYQTWIDVNHFIRPNEAFNPKKLDSRFKRFSSCYYETDTEDRNNERYLRDAGYDYMPILAPRWETTGEDSYGTDCPGMIALGDNKQLQHGEKQIAHGIDKTIRPPMVAPMQMRNQKTSILPGDVTFLDKVESFRPAVQVNFNIDQAEGKQAQVRQRVDKAFYVDLFLMLANSDRREITAREIDERHEEKLLALGPVLEGLNQDDLDPGIDIVFDMNLRQRRLPPPPDELKGMPLKVEYVSIMQQAQKLVGLAGQERFASFYSQLAALDPGLRHKVNLDQMIDDYGDACGVSPKVIVPDEDAQAARAAEQEAAAAAAKAEQMRNSAATVKDLSATNTSEKNALTDLVAMAEAGL